MINRCSLIQRPDGICQVCGGGFAPLHLERAIRPQMNAN
jgi:hypothetical protein